MKYSERITQQQRLAILQALAQDDSYCANDLILAAWLDELGLAASRDKLRTELAWLQEQGLLAVEVLNGTNSGGLHIATLAARGLDVVEGKAKAPGIARPRPE